MTYAINFTRPGMLHAALICQSTDPEARRGRLCGVHVEPCPAGGVYIVATDGHRLALGLDRKATIEGNMPAGGVILPIPKECLAKLKEGRGAPPAVRFDGGTFSLAGVAYPCTPIDGTFPDWRRVLPGPDNLAAPSPSVGFNATYLADFGKIAKGFGKSHPALRLASADPGGPAWVDIQVPDWRGVLMPMQWKNDAPPFADFL